MGLTHAQITAAALDVLESDGLDKLSLRAVAARLEVRVNSVAWHVKDKAGLLSAAADAVIADCLPAHLPADPDERVRLLLTSYRAALRSRRDGAGLAREGFSLAGPHQLAFVEAFNAALRATGRSPKEAAWTAWTLIHFVLSLVDEEQMAPELTHGAKVAADPATFPCLAAAAEHLNADNYDDRFAYSVELILTGRSGKE
ncbi:TetR/AcrR family transcriptional regulator C-terminal domain-containing protein [Streptomyces scopuliridis]|uniref:TetR/AcrR family transcriptional regulator C-terminal domain-containing protein n=1 Tax=Streptomyces scopuliridis TaxID=452529 RepID=UPI0036C80885